MARAMLDNTITSFVSQLAARSATPGGGATASLAAAQAAALLAMVARYSDGPKYAEARENVQHVIRQADLLWEAALQLTAADAAAFAVVVDAYRLPTETPVEKESRSRAIEAALVGAAEPPCSTILLVEEILTLAEALASVGNPNVISDIAAAAESARSAGTISRVNIEVNVRSLSNPAERERLQLVAGTVDGLVDRAQGITEAVRQRLR